MPVDVSDKGDLSIIFEESIDIDTYGEHSLNYSWVQTYSLQGETNL